MHTELKKKSFSLRTENICLQAEFCPWHFVGICNAKTQNLIFAGFLDAHESQMVLTCLYDWQQHWNIWSKAEGCDLKMIWSLLDRFWLEIHLLILTISSHKSPLNYRASLVMCMVWSHSPSPFNHILAELKGV